MISHRISQGFILPRQLWYQYSDLEGLEGFVALGLAQLVNRLVYMPLNVTVAYW